MGTLLAEVLAFFIEYSKHGKSKKNSIKLIHILGWILSIVLIQRIITLGHSHAELRAQIEKNKACSIHIETINKK